MLVICTGDQIVTQNMYVRENCCSLWIDVEMKNSQRNSNILHFLNS